MDPFCNAGQTLTIDYFDDDQRPNESSPGCEIRQSDAGRAELPSLRRGAITAKRIIPRGLTCRNLLSGEVKHSDGLWPEIPFRHER
jgi:hypothetical protein